MFANEIALITKGDSKMKKILRKIGDFFGTLCGIVLLLIVGICLVLSLPFDYIKYKRSHYYKTIHKKYTLFAAMGSYFELYNEIIKNDLPIKYFSNPNETSLEYGWFVYDNTLIISNVFSFKYNFENCQWNYCVEDEEAEGERFIMPLDEYIETEIQEANQLAGEVICDKAVVLIDASCIENIDLAKKEKRFLVYDDNREDVLISFCKRVRNV